MAATPYKRALNESTCASMSAWGISRQARRAAAKSSTSVCGRRFGGGRAACCGVSSIFRKSTGRCGESGLLCSLRAAAAGDLLLVAARGSIGLRPLECALQTLALRLVRPALVGGHLPERFLGGLEGSPARGALQVGGYLRGRHGLQGEHELWQPFEGVYARVKRFDGCDRVRKAIQDKTRGRTTPYS